MRGETEAMPAYKDKKNGSWYLQFRYTDWTGERRPKVKRGFSTKREALEWERQFLMQRKADNNMTFESFVELYERDMKPKVRLNTWKTKASVIQSKIMPYFAKKRLCEITARDVLEWQNTMRQLCDKQGDTYTDTYLRNIHNQLTAIFNHAVKFYELQVNPATKAGSMGQKERREMEFWTKEEYLRFADAMMDKPMSFYAFEVLYWTGVRLGELLALTKRDFDFEKRTMTINKSYQRIDKQDLITEPKTPKSNRTIQLPKFLCEELQDYFRQIYGADKTSRIFPVTKHYLRHEMIRGCQETGVKEIRLHDLRHSHVSLLIDMGFSALAIADRVGHETIDITYRYAHLFPSKQRQMADQLDFERGGEYVTEMPGSKGTLAE